MKKKILCIVTLFFFFFICSFGLSSCKEVYEASQVDSIIANLKTSIETNKIEQDKKIEEITLQYQAKDNELLLVIEGEQKVLADLKTSYELALKELQDKDLATEKAIEDLDTKYNQELEKLLENDSENLAKLEELKSQHDIALKELQDKDLAIDKTIEDLDAKYCQEVERLQNKINLANQQIDNNKQAFEIQIEAINVLYNAKIVEINNVIDMLKTTNNSQDEIISSLIDRVTNLESAMQIKEIVIADIVAEQTNYLVIHKNKRLNPLQQQAFDIIKNIK